MNSTSTSLLAGTSAGCHATLCLGYGDSDSKERGVHEVRVGASGVTRNAYLRDLRATQRRNFSPERNVAGDPRCIGRSAQLRAHSRAALARLDVLDVARILKIVPSTRCDAVLDMGWVSEPRYLPRVPAAGIRAEESCSARRANNAATRTHGTTAMNRLHLLADRQRLSAFIRWASCDFSRGTEDSGWRKKDRRRRRGEHGPWLAADRRPRRDASHLAPVLHRRCQLRKKLATKPAIKRRGISRTSCAPSPRASNLRARCGSW